MPPSPVNERELRVVGMSRSGNHAIINWILAQQPGSYCFLNCAEPKTNPFLTARDLPDGKPYRTNIPEFSLRKEQEGNFSKKDLLLYSYEDTFLGPLASPYWREHREDFVGRSRETLDVLILRDPFNLFASRIKSGFYCARNIFGEQRATPRETVRIWKQHAREYIKPGRYLSKNLVTISFNDWTTSREYREGLAAKLEVPFTDASFRRVATVGGGSSFDKTAMDGQPQRMRLQERWKHFSDNPQYLAMIDDEILQLSRRIFGPMSAADQITRDAS